MGSTLLSLVCHMCTPPNFSPCLLVRCDPSSLFSANPMSHQLGTPVPVVLAQPACPWPRALAVHFVGCGGRAGGRVDMTRSFVHHAHYLICVHTCILNMASEQKISNSSSALASLSRWLRWNAACFLASALVSSLRRELMMFARSYDTKARFRRSIRSHHVCRYTTQTHTFIPHRFGVGHVAGRGGGGEGGNKHRAGRKIRQTATMVGEQMRRTDIVAGPGGGCGKEASTERAWRRRRDFFALTLPDCCHRGREGRGGYLAWFVRKFLLKPVDRPRSIGLAVRKTWWVR